MPTSRVIIGTLGGVSVEALGEGLLLACFGEDQEINSGLEFPWHCQDDIPAIEEDLCLQFGVTYM